MKRSEPHPSLDGTLRRLLWSMLLLVCVILVATLPLPSIVGGVVVLAIGVAYRAARLLALKRR